MKILSLVLLFYFVIPHSYALDINDRLSVKILATGENNILILSRGFEDGVMVGTHGKLVGSEGYVGRLLCIKVGALSSHWKIYRVANPELISRDLDYTLYSHDQSELAPTIKSVRDENYVGSLPVFDEKTLETETRRPVPVNDLPEKLEGDQGFIFDKKSGMMIERNISQRQFRNDFKNYKGQIYVAPFSKQSINNSEVVRVGGKFQNQGTKYKMSLSADKNRSKLSDPLLKKDVVYDTTTANAEFEIADISPKWHFVSMVNYRQVRYGDISTPKQHVLTGPLGLRYEIYQSDRVKNFDITYVAFYDHRVTEAYTDTARTQTDRRVTNGFRHGIRVNLDTKLGDSWDFVNSFWYRPRQNQQSYKFDTADNYMVEDLGLIYHFNPKFALDYHLTYTYDIAQKRLSNLPAANTIYSLNVRYDFNL